MLVALAVCLLFIQALNGASGFFASLPEVVSTTAGNSSNGNKQSLQQQQVYGVNISSMLMMNQPSGPVQMTNASLSGSSNQPLKQPKTTQAASTKTHPPTANSRPPHNKDVIAMSMAAEGSNDSSSFVTINSGSTSVSEVANSSPKQPAQIGKQAKTIAKAPQSNKIGQQQPQQLKQQPPKPRFVSQSQQDQAMQALMMQRYQQQQQLELEPPPAPQLQLERPSPPAGYAYEPSSSSGASGGYTHTSQLQPARQEVLVAEQVAQKQQRFRLPTSADLAGARTAVSSGEFGPRSAIAPAASSQQQQHIEQVQIGNHAPPKRPFLSPVMMPSPHLSVTGTATNPCKPPTSSLPNANQFQPQELIQQTNDVASALPNFGQGAPSWPPSGTKYLRAGDGTRLRSQYIFKVIRADSLTDCELACSRASSLAANNPQEACRSFNYRAYFAAENCELSRHDIRSLKLEDGAQFEQHTQFDFYALDSTSSAQMQASGSSNSLVYSPFPEPECLDVSQSCSQDGMEFTLRTTEPFNGRIYTYGFYDSCFFDGEGSLTSVLRISRSNGFPRCGTQQIGDLMTNIVVVQFNDYVQTTRDKKYNLTCFFSGPGEAVVTSNYLDTKIDERSHPMQIEHLPPQNVITSNVQLRVLYRNQPTNTIALGDMLTFRLETKSLLHQSSAQHRANDGSHHEIFATNVIAKDPYSGRQVQLIDGRGCPIDPVHVFPELQRTPDGALEAEFYAFKIPDSNFLIFQATVRTCKAPCEPVICQTSTNSNSQLDATRAQYTQIPLSSTGIKGGSSLPAYLLQSSHNHQQHQLSVPSWGKRRRRRREVLDETNPNDDDEIIQASQLESVEHVIPVIRANSQHQQQSELMSPNRGGQVKSWRQPELSEPEEEVKEMFRVYMSRAEINRQQRERASLLRSPSPLLPMATEMLPAPNTSNQLVIKEPSEQQQDLREQICMTLFGYHVMLFTVIALSLLMLSVLLVSLYIARRAKFRVSDSLADSIF